MTNPFTSTPEAAQFWREQQQACEEARRLLVKHPIFAQFLASGGTLAVVPDGFPISDNFAALLKDGDSVYACIPFFVTDGDAYRISRAIDDLAQLTAWLTEASDGAKPAKNEICGNCKYHDGESYCKKLNIPISQYEEECDAFELQPF